RSREDRADLAQIRVVHVVRYELAIPEQLAAAHVERDRGVRIEVVPFARSAEEIGRWIANRQVEDALGRVERERRPQAAAAVCTRLRILPTIGPGFVVVRN